MSSNAPIMGNLVSKYNVAAPRYTSYPTVPYWEQSSWSLDGWLDQVRRTFSQSGGGGVSIYVHLPYCESLCTYCGCNTRITKNHQVEDPYIGSVLKEWSLYRQLLGGQKILLNELHLGGGTPTFFSPENLHRLITGILQHMEINSNASLSFEAHPANTSKAHLQTLYDLGFRRLSLGVQDFDQQVQDIINRKQTKADVWRVMEEARAVGYTSVNFDLVYGLPLQTIATVRDTVLKSIVLRPERISFYSYAHVPWMKPGQRRFTELDLPSGNEKLQLYHVGKQLIAEAGYKDVGMDHFALPGDELFVSADEGKLHRNFMGYTDRYTPLLIGLGVSSISDAWGAFAQNVKTVEAYHTLIGNGEFPLAKGHIHTAEDLKLRRNILDIMCKGHTQLDGSQIKNADQIMQRLMPLQGDGLIAIDESHIQVTETGRSFLRNICMAFDNRMHRQKQKEQLFSSAI